MLFQSDASALEVRIAAFLAQDKTLMDEIITGEDIHRRNQVLFKLPGWDIEDKQDDTYKLGRLTAKTFVFRTIYGGNEFSFANDPNFTHVSTSKAYWKDIIDTFYNKYQGLAKWHKSIVKEVIQTGKLVAPTGREYRFQKYNGEYKDTQIKNYSVQGSGHDVMSLARVSAWRRLKELGYGDKCLMVNTVHDSIILDFDEKVVDVHKLDKLFHEVFRDIPANFKKMFGVEFNIPMSCENLVGHNWADMQEIK